MSSQCKMLQSPLYKLKPLWVEFTTTKGLLRVLRPDEDTARARGMIFLCPRCKDNKKTRHNLIFLFDHPDVPSVARPLNRFKPARDKQDKLENLAKQSLYQHDPHHYAGRTLLQPQDMPCKWEGFVQDGVVSWRPNLRERWKAF